MSEQLKDILESAAELHGWPHKPKPMTNEELFEKLKAEMDRKFKILIFYLAGNFALIIIIIGLSKLI